MVSEEFEDLKTDYQEHLQVRGGMLGSVLLESPSRMAIGADDAWMVRA